MSFLGIAFGERDKYERLQKASEDARRRSSEANEAEAKRSRLFDEADRDPSIPISMMKKQLKGRNVDTSDLKTRNDVITAWLQVFKER